MDQHIEDQLDLKDFLEEADLEQYYALFRDILKVTKLSQLKFVHMSDLAQIGLSKPEQRHYKKVYAKYFPNICVMKLRKIFRSKKNLPHTYARPSNLRPIRSSINVHTKHIIPFDDIIINNELGTGEFGIVQQGIWITGNERVQVAVKCLTQDRMASESGEFLKEAAVMHNIDHPNIIRLYGVVLCMDSLMLVTELAPYRSLLDCLREVTLRSEFSVSTLCYFAEQICDGMTYLESKRLIHRDLAIRNILVFSKDKVKISDFGLSRALGADKDYYQINYSAKLKLPVAWCAPECILYLKFTSASDVWAYAVCLWEMFSYGYQPWAGLSGSQILSAIDVPHLKKLEQPFYCPLSYYNIMLQCWEYEPRQRPRFRDIGPKLRDMYFKKISKYGASFYTPPSDLEQEPLINPSSLSQTTDSATSAPIYQCLQEDTRSARLRGTGAIPKNYGAFGPGKCSKKKSGVKSTMVPMSSKSLLNRMKSATLGTSLKMDTESWPTTSTAEEEHEYQEISEKYDGDPTDNITEEMGSMFKSLDIAGRKKNPLFVKNQPQQDVSTRAQTLGKVEKKKTLNTSTMKPMSAHDQKTLDTAVALANELTARSMTDLEVNNHKQANSPSERSKFHFKFPLGLGSLGHSHESQKYPSSKHGRKNFSEQAKGVPDIQAILTEESKRAYISLIEEPALASRLPEDLATNDFTQQNPSHHKYLSPRRIISSINQSANVEKPITNTRTCEDYKPEQTNVLPLPPRSAQTRLVDKPRHKRKYPLVIPSTSHQDPNFNEQTVPSSNVCRQSVPSPDIRKKSVPFPNVYEQTASTSQKPPPKHYQNLDMIRYLDGAQVIDQPYCSEKVFYQNINVIRSTDILDDTPSPQNQPSDSTYETDESVDSYNNNPFTNESYGIARSVNPFTTPEPSVSPLTAEKNTSRKGSSSNLQALDHVSVEDLLEFADLKPCGRQRGIESDEVRLMSKVLKEEVTPESCLEALELTDWDVHLAIKLLCSPCSSP